MKTKKINKDHILLFLALLFIPFTPYIFTHWIDTGFDLKGQIGDTIGGITAPFINVLAAILVYLAFKEQIKANNLIKEQLYFQHVESQIERFERSSKKVEKIETILLSDFQDSKINKLVRHIHYKDDVQIKYTINLFSVRQLSYITTSFIQTFKLIAQIGENRLFLEGKLINLFYFLYYRHFVTILKVLSNHKELIPSEQMDSFANGYIINLREKMEELIKFIEERGENYILNS